MRVLYETEAFCHRLEDVSSSLRGLPTLKELSATLRPGLHTPSTQMEGPLVRDDAEVALVLSLPLSLSFSLLCSLFFFLPSYAFLFLCLYSPVPLLLFSLRCLWSAAWHASRTPPRPGHRRFSFDVPCDSRTPSFAASRVRFENYPETIIFCGDRAIHRGYVSRSRLSWQLIASACLLDDVSLTTFSKPSFLWLVCLVMTLRYPLMHHLHVRSLVKDTRCVYRWENSIWRSRDVEQFRSILLDILIFGREILSIFSERNVENLSVLQTSSRYTMRSLSLCCTGSLSILVFGILFGAGGRFQHSSRLSCNDFFIRFVL